MTSIPGPPASPVAHRQHTETTLHCITLTDDYAWLRDKQNPKVTAYLEAENAYAEAIMAPLNGLRKNLYQQMLSHIKQTDVSVPYRDGDWWYYNRTEEGKQYAIICRTHGSPNATEDTPEQVILDGNQLAEGHPFLSIGATDITSDGRWLAYTTDTTGFRQYTLHIKDLTTGETLPDEVLRVGSVVWAADKITLFYTVEDEEQKRQYQLWRHTLGTPHSQDALVHQEDDERFNLAAGRTRDGKFIVMESASHITSESRVLPAAEPEGAFTLISPRQDEHEYSIDHRNGLWYIRTNDQGRNFRLVTAPIATPGRENWTERIPHRADIMLEEVDLFAGFFIACEREGGLPRLRMWSFSGNGPEAAPAGEISFPEPAYSAHPHINRVFDATTFRYAYQSLVTPSSVYEYDVPTGASTLLKQLEVPGGFDRTLYASERVQATAPDGVQVPISLVYRKDKFQTEPAAPGPDTVAPASEAVAPASEGISRIGVAPTSEGVSRIGVAPASEAAAPASEAVSRIGVAPASRPAVAGASRPPLNPLYVYAYGSYGYSLPLGFSSNRLSLLDRGVVMAYAHIRGGADLGEPWHDAGKMLLKRNTFTDFIAAVEHLTTAGYGDPAKVAIEGGSAGGLLMGAVVNMRPDLFRAVVSHVPFVDVMNTMLDATLPLTVPEYEEWGNPNEAEYFNYMLSYSPYDNLKPASYPAMLVKTSLHDSQVMYWEPAKYVAKLRTLKADNNPLLLVTNMQAGHGGSSGRYDYLKEIAFDYAFLLRELGIVW